jgi:DNA sulfur modification protein DndC
MKMVQTQDFFAGSRRLQMTESIELTEQSLRAYGVDHPHWGLAWSGGKDSTATLTVVAWLLDTGRVPSPRSLTVFYADTRMELTPLAIAAMQIMDELRDRGIDVQVVRAPLDRRFFVYILGRGVPPPNNNTLRWCTRQIKIDPMGTAIATRLDDLDRQSNHGPALDDAAPKQPTFLMITGVRQGESAMRDRRIEMSCGKDGAECGQGWYQQVLPESKGVRGRIATLAPLLHWRVCHVWEWLKHWAPAAEFGDWSTAMIADAYGGDEAEEINARTGCVGCPLASKDTALETVLRNPAWAYLAPLKGLKPLYRELRLARNRLRQPGGERRKDGTLAKNQQRMGPLTFAARLMGLERVLEIQADVNAGGRRLGRPTIDLLDGEEERRIRELIAAGTWPEGWRGDEPRADVPLPAYFSDGCVQPLLLT